MKDINLSEILTIKRRERGITQDELATYIGVTKASVSKWETGVSLPDITLLPVLASYFDMSVDALIGYEPQLNKTEIKSIYSELSSSFMTLDFENAVLKSETYVKKYYSCYPFLLEIVQLYINHAPFAKNSQQKNALLESAVELCNRVNNFCREAAVLRKVPPFLAMCKLLLGKPNEVLEILGKSVEPTMNASTLIVQAYQYLGNAEKSSEMMQVDMYQNLMGVFSALCMYIQSNLANYDVAIIAYNRAETLANSFAFRQLNPNNMAVLYTMGAMMYQTAGNQEKTLELLGKYVDVCIHGFFPFTLKGDQFFDKIDNWLSENSSSQPRNDEIVKESMLNDVLLHPIFNSLHDNTKYNHLVTKMRELIGGK